MRSSLAVISLLLASVAAPVVRGASVEYFDLSQVRLTDGPFKRAQDVDREYILALNPDRLLSGFRSEAGLEPKAPKYPNWESSGLDGHTLGHYLTALAQMWQATGDAECKRRLDYIVGELGECQRANGNGYVGAVPHSRKLWAAIAAGEFDAQGFSLEGAWVPWYNMHKTFAGLRDAWLLGGNAAARDILIHLADWSGDVIGGLSDEKVQVMLRAEQGGMCEVLADVYAITGNEKYLALARRFTHRALLDPLLAHEDKLTGLHANTQIPKVVGIARIAELTHDDTWRDAAKFFWTTVVDHRSTVIGGNSVREHFNPTDDFSSLMESREGPETCNTYNMLRLTERLFRGEPTARYADYYERALYNHILSSEHPDHGGFVYFTPMRERDYRVYSQPEQCFWCCVGTGMENHGKYGRFIYAREGDDLFVNLFIPSELTWAEAGLVVRQENTFPFEPRTKLTLSLKAPRKFAIHLRDPDWVADGALAIRINGERQSLDAHPGSYVVLEREWRDGDRLEVELPMHTVAEGLPDGSPYVAFVRGPIVLAARTGTEDLDGLVAGDGRMAHIGPGPLEPLDGAPVLVGDRATFEARLQPVADHPLHFTAPGLIQPATFRNLELEPFFQVHDARYVIYWRTATAGEYPQLVRDIEARERERLALEARTIDQVTPGLQQPEVEHQFAGDHTNTGINLGRNWRAATGSFGYDLRAEPGAKMALLVTYWEGHWGTQRFRILLNDRVLATVERSNQPAPHFVTETYEIPASLVGEEDHCRVKFVASDQSSVAPVYEIRLVHE